MSNDNLAVISTETIGRDALTIAVFAAEQMLSDAKELSVTFVLTQFGPIVQIETN